MLNILSGYTSDFKVLIHEILDTVIDYFIEVGSNLDFDEIYASIFPLHLRDDEEFIKSHLFKLHRHIVDDYNHNLTSLDEHTLYCMILYVYEGTDDGFVIDDIINQKLQSNEMKDLNEQELEWLHSVDDISSLIGVCFEDTDFLDIGLYFEWYKARPDLLDKVAHIDLDFYKDIMPEDILQEYNEIKRKRKSVDEHSYSYCIHNKEEFYKIVYDAIKEFNKAVVHKKLNRVLNKNNMQADEKDVQAIFNTFANMFLKPYDIVIVPEVDTGRGAVDFHLSLGNKYQALVEFKLSTNGQKQDGIKYQLPIYLITTDIEFGIFVLICYNKKSYESAAKLYDTAKIQSKRLNKKIEFVRINAARDLKTASKIRCWDELELEDWRDI